MRDFDILDSILLLMVFLQLILLIVCLVTDYASARAMQCDLEIETLKGKIALLNRAIDGMAREAQGLEQSLDEMHNDARERT